MTIAAALLSLMAPAAATRRGQSHVIPDLIRDHEHRLAEIAQSAFMDPGLRQDDALALRRFRTLPRRAPPHPPPSRRRISAGPRRPPSEEALIDDRRRPGVPQHDLPDPVNQVNPGAIRSPPPEAFPAEHVADPRPLAADPDARPGPRALVGPLQPEHAKGDRPICVPTMTASVPTRSAAAPTACSASPATTGSSSSAPSPTR